MGVVAATAVSRCWRWSLLAYIAVVFALLVRLRRASHATLRVPVPMPDMTNEPFQEPEAFWMTKPISSGPAT